MSTDRLSVQILCCRENFQKIRSTPVDIHPSRLGPVPDPLGCDIFAEDPACQRCRKYLIELLMYHNYVEGSVLDPRDPLPPKPDT